jgi:hypothetical protein
MSDNHVEPLALSIKRTAEISGESRSRVYEHIGSGAYQAVKSGGKTLVLYESVKRRLAGLPPAKIKPKRSSAT